MGKQVKVKFTGRQGFAACITRDLTVGKEYDAYIPDATELDVDGLPPQYGDKEYWLTDDAGDGVVVNGAYGFELMEVAV